MRWTWLVAVLFGALAVAPARAADYVCVTGSAWAACAYGTDVAGETPSSSQPPPGSRAAVEAESVTAACDYEAHPTAVGTRDYVFSGNATATTTHSDALPEVVVVKCTLTSPAQGLPGEVPTQTTSFQVACGLPTCASASSVAGWPARPVILCTDAYAIFGPTPVITKYAPHACTETYL